MGIIAVRERALEKMEHAIGFNFDKVKKNKYNAYRNHYAAPKCDDNDWLHLVDIGFAKRGDVTDNCIMYHVTRDGIDFIERVTGTTITEDD